MLSAYCFSISFHFPLLKGVFLTNVTTRIEDKSPFVYSECSCSVSLNAVKCEAAATAVVMGLWVQGLKRHPVPSTCLIHPRSVTPCLLQTVTYPVIILFQAAAFLQIGHLDRK